MTIPANESQDAAADTDDKFGAHQLEEADVQWKHRQQQQQESEPDIEVGSSSSEPVMASTTQDKAKDISKKSDATKQQQQTTVNSDTSSSISSSRYLPRACYCPKTGKILREPVVHPNGESYEKSAILEQDEPGVICYPNRALKTFIEKEMESISNNNNVSSTSSEGGSLLSRSNWESLLQTVALPFSEQNPLPDSFYCPITFDLIYEPVIDKDGYSYEQAALINWIKVNADSPVTRQPLRAEDLYKNKAILKIMLEITEGDPDSLQPPLLRWRQELNNRPQSEAPLDFEMMTVPDVESMSDNSEGSETHPRHRHHHNHHRHNQHPYTHYPETQAELNAMRRRNVQVIGFCIVCGALFSLVLYIFSPRYFLFLMICGSIFYCVKMAQARRRVRQRADRAFREA